MSVKVYGVEELMARLAQGGERAVRGVLDQMRKEGAEMAALASKFAPKDDGELESAIKVRDGEGQRGLDGRFQRKTVEIYVDMNMPTADGRTVGTYAYEMHEHLTPYGPLQLGPESVSKQAGQSEMVGGKFLERAVEERADKIVENLTTAAKKAL